VGDPEPSTDARNGNSQKAFLSDDGGPAVDLNTLIPANAGIQLTDAVYINDSGEIAAIGAISDNDIRAFVLIPCDDNHPGVDGCDYGIVEAAPVVTQTTAAVRDAASSALPASLMRRMVRYHLPGLGVPRGN
jgi:hypothetical protein